MKVPSHVRFVSTLLCVGCVALNSVNVGAQSATSGFAGATRATQGTATAAVPAQQRNATIPFKTTFTNLLTSLQRTYSTSQQSAVYIPEAEALMRFIGSLNTAATIEAYEALSQYLETHAADGLESIIPFLYRKLLILDFAFGDEELTEQVKTLIVQSLNSLVHYQNPARPNFLMPVRQLGSNTVARQKMSALRLDIAQYGRTADNGQINNAAQLEDLLGFPRNCGKGIGALNAPGVGPTTTSGSTPFGGLPQFAGSSGGGGGGSSQSSASGAGKTSPGAAAAVTAMAAGKPPVASSGLNSLVSFDVVTPPAAPMNCMPGSSQDRMGSTGVFSSSCFVDLSVSIVVAGRDVLQNGPGELYQLLENCPPAMAAYASASRGIGGIQKFTAGSGAPTPKPTPKSAPSPKSSPKPTPTPKEKLCAENQRCKDLRVNASVAITYYNNAKKKPGVSPKVLDEMKRHALSAALQAISAANALSRFYNAGSNPDGIAWKSENGSGSDVDYTMGGGIGPASPTSPFGGLDLNPEGRSESHDLSTPTVNPFSPSLNDDLEFASKSKLPGCRLLASFFRRGQANPGTLASKNTSLQELFDPNGNAKARKEGYDCGSATDMAMMSGSHCPLTCGDGSMPNAQCQCKMKAAVINGTAPKIQDTRLAPKSNPAPIERDVPVEGSGPRPGSGGGGGVDSRTGR